MHHERHAIFSKQEQGSGAPLLVPQDSKCDGCPQVVGHSHENQSSSSSGTSASNILSTVTVLVKVKVAATARLRTNLLHI